MNEGNFCPVAHSPVSQMLIPGYKLFGLKSNWIWRRLIFSFLVISPSLDSISAVFWKLNTTWDCDFSLPPDCSSVLLLFSRFFFISFFFYVDQILKSLLNLLRYCFCFMFWFFGHEAGGILVPQPRIESAPLHWKVKSSPLNCQGKSLFVSASSP